LGFNVRRKAFNQKFYYELTPVAAAAGVNSYWPGEYIRRSEKMLFPDGYRRIVIRVSSSGRINQDIKKALAYFMLPEQVADRRSNDLKTYGPNETKKYTPRD